LRPGIAHDPHRPVGPQVTDPERRDLGEPRAGVEQEQDDGTLARLGDGERPLQLGVGEGGDEPARDERQPRRGSAPPRIKDADLIRRGPIWVGTPENTPVKGID
jgi:hypothetical protein